MTKASGKITVDYEGVGTCIEATIKVNGRRICTISAFDTRTNKATNKIIQSVIKSLQQTKQ